MNTNELTVAVTGLNATDNPGPGVAVIRSLRHHPDFKGRIVGLAYDSLDPGIYAGGLCDDVFLIPYPSQGVDALEERLRYIHSRIGLHVIIPTLDAELSSFMALEQSLSQRGIHTFCATREQFDLRSKHRLTEVGRRAGISVPATRVITDVSDLYTIHEEIPFPLWVKGPFYGAERASTVSEAVQAFHVVAASWGLPVIVQTSVVGDEMNVVAVGDGRGGLVGAMAMRKMVLTDKGKGWAGIAIKDPQLLEMAERFMSRIEWRGPCELEVIRTAQGQYHLLEINPRFPAWVHLSAGAGMNLPYAVLSLAIGEEVEPMRDYQAGTMFVRIAIDQITSIHNFQQIASTGEIMSQGGVQ